MKRAKGRASSPTRASYRAGCGRAWPEASAEPDLAYIALEFSECPACPHRLEPEDGPSFCRLLREGQAHPFAGLAGLEVAG